MKQWYALADALSLMEIEAVNFGGGECPLASGFVDFCRYLRNFGIKLGLTTNGSSQSFQEIERYVDLFHEIGVSMDFAEAKLHDSFRGYKGAFEEAVTTIGQLVDYGINTELVTCLTNNNCSRSMLSHLHSLCTDLKVDYWRTTRFHPVGRGSASLDLSLTPNALEQAYSFLYELQPDGVFSTDPLFQALIAGTDEESPCQCGRASLRIGSNGAVTPGPYIHRAVGNVTEENLDDLLQHSALLQQLRKRELFGKCRICPKRHVCGGGCGSAVYAIEGHLQAPDPACWVRPGQDPDPAESGTKLTKKNHGTIHEYYLCTTYVSIRS
jgi:radical SAM protein with 4Fe4S-binding SPASM domain